jgi:hypothetical protein
MPTSAGELYFGLGVNTKGAEEGVKKSFGNMAKAAVGLGAAFIGGALAIGKLASFLSESVAAAAEADAVYNDLTQSLARAGVEGAQAASKDFAEFATTLQMMTGIEDDAIIKAGALGAKFGMSEGVLKQTTATAADLSAALGMDLQGAMSLLTKAAGGNTAMLGRYGIQIKSTGDNTKDFAAVLTTLNAKFGGAAAAAMSTYAGRVTLLGNVWGNVKESVGQAVTQSKLVNAVIQETTKAFAKLEGSVSSNNRATDGLIGKTWNALIIGARVVVAGIAGASMAFDGLKIVLNGLAYIAVKPFELLVAGIESVIRSAGNLADMAGVDSISQAATGAANSVAGLRQSLSDMGAVFASSADEGVQGIYAAQDSWNSADDAVVQFNTDVLTAAASMGTVIPEAARTAAAGVEGAFAGFDLSEIDSGLTESLNATLNQSQTVYEGIKEQIAARYAFEDSIMMAQAAKAEEAGAAQIAQAERVSAAQIGVAQGMGDAFAGAFQSIAAGSENAGVDMIKAVIKAAQIAVQAYIAVGMAAAAAGQSAIPVVGWVTAGIAAAVIGGLITGFLARIPKAAEGGIVAGGTPGRDSVLAMLMPGELVIPTDLASGLLGMLTDLTPRRSLSVPAFASGGVVPRMTIAGSRERSGDPEAVVVHYTKKVVNPSQRSGDVTRDVRELADELTRLYRIGQFRLEPT